MPLSGLVVGAPGDECIDAAMVVWLLREGERVVLFDSGVHGIDLFPNATVHIQRDEYVYDTGTAWQEEGRKGGIDDADILELVRRNTAGRVRFVEGDDVEVLPDIRAFSGTRHHDANRAAQTRMNALSQSSRRRPGAAGKTRRSSSATSMEPSRISRSSIAASAMSRRPDESSPGRAPAGPARRASARDSSGDSSAAAAEDLTAEDLLRKTYGGRPTAEDLRRKTYGGR